LHAARKSRYVSTCYRSCLTTSVISDYSPPSDPLIYASFAAAIQLVCLQVRLKYACRQYPCWKPIRCAKHDVLPAASVLRKATDSQPSKKPRIDHGLLIVQTRGSRRMYFQPLPHEKRTSEQDPKGISRGVSDRSVCFLPSIRSSNPIFTLTLFFQSRRRETLGALDIAPTQNSS